MEVWDRASAFAASVIRVSISLGSTPIPVTRAQTGTYIMVELGGAAPRRADQAGRVLAQSRMTVAKRSGWALCMACAASGSET